PLFTLMCVALTCAPAPAQEAEALRKEIEQLQRQLKALGDRLQRLESQPPPAAPALQPAPPTYSGISPIDLARPRQPFSLYQQRGAGQLLFDIGVTDDFVGNVTQSNVEKAQGGTFAGQENRFFPREVELSLFGQIDPYAFAEVRIEAGEDTRGADTKVDLAEASITMLTLPYGTQAKFGQIRNRFGYSNVIHEHDLPWIDRPNVLRNFLGDGGLQEKGLEATIVPDLPFYLEGLVTVTGEAIYSLRRVLVGVDTDGDGLTDLIKKRERDRFGWYTSAEVQPFRRWAAGVRYDWSEFPANPGKERSVEPYITFWPSEFLRFRLAYKNTDRTH